MYHIRKNDEAPEPPDGSRAFVALAREGAVVAIDLKTLTGSSKLQTGPGADGMAWVK
jgi:hypothetical protein